MGDERDALAELRMLLEERVEGGEPAQHVLRQVGAVDADDQVVAPARQHLLLVRRDRVRRGRLAQPVGVDRHRIGPDPRLAIVLDHHPALVVDLELHQLAAAGEEVAAVRGGVEPDDVVREQPAEDLLPHPAGQNPPAVGLRPRDVDEVLQEGVRPRRADQTRARVQVVVVEHHQRPVLAVDLAQHRLRDVAIDDLVAELPRVGLIAPDVGRVGQIPQVVLDEPQDRVRDHVVEAVVRQRLALHQQNLVVHPAKRHLHRPAGLGADGNVLVGERRRDPQRAPMRDQVGERAHQAAASAAHDPIALRVALELGRTAVGDDYELVFLRGHLSAPAPSIRTPRPLRRPAPERPPRHRRAATASRGAAAG